LFEVTAGPEAAAQPSGLLAVLDDLQWADAATVQLLAPATGVTPARLMVVATYRDTGTADRGRFTPPPPRLPAKHRSANTVGRAG
jgi:hypothetical protein